MSSKTRRTFRPGGCRPGSEALEVRALLSSVPVVADFNNDGKPDVVSGDTIRLGNGDGTFRPPSTVSPSPFIVQGTGRFRGAGAPIDLLLIDPGDFATSLGSVAVALGRGDGTFSPPVKLPAILPGTPVAGQFTPDGDLDLMVVTTTLTGPSQLALFRGNGDGTFRPAVLTTLARSSDIRDVADLNGDGRSDLVLNVLNSPELNVLLGRGDGTFGAPIRVNSGSNSSTVGDVAVGRLRGPNAPIDLVTANNDFPGSVSILLGRGDGTFLPAARITINQNASPRSLALADLDGDGRLDIVTTNQFDNARHVTGIDVLLGNGDGTFRAPRFIATDGIVSQLTAADLNGDRAPDVVVTGQNFGVFLNRGDGVLLPPGTSAIPTVTALTSDLNPAEVGQRETLTATVTAQAGTPTGTVTFFDGRVVLGTSPVGPDGRATLAVSLGIGSHSVTATFGGNGTFAASTSAPLTETVFNHIATTTALTASRTTAAVGQSVTFTATVVPAAPGGGTPQGSVLFQSGGVTLGVALVDGSGVATIRTRFATPGDRVITAVYTGDSMFAGSSRSLTEHVLATLGVATRTMPSALSVVGPEDRAASPVSGLPERADKKRR